jgi:hypothetical protein
MSTTKKTKKTKKTRKPPTGGQTSHGIPRPRGSAHSTRPRSRFARTSATPAANGPSGLIGRVHANLPGRKPPAKKSPVEGALSALGSAKSSAAAHKPSKKGIVGIVAGGVGGVGVAAMAKRRRDDKQDEVPMTQAVSPAEASGENSSPTAA